MLIELPDDLQHRILELIVAGRFDTHQEAIVEAVRRLVAQELPALERPDTDVFSDEECSELEGAIDELDFMTQSPELDEQLDSSEESRDDWVV